MGKIYEINRMSDYGTDGDPKPCKNVFGCQHKDGWYIYIDSIPQLESLIDETGSNLVIGKDTILIYDDYME